MSPTPPPPPVPSRTRLARHLGLEPRPAEIAAGYDSPALLVADVVLSSDAAAWLVITHRGGKHRIPVGEVRRG